LYVGGVRSSQETHLWTPRLVTRISLLTLLLPSYVTLKEGQKYFRRTGFIRVRLNTVILNVTLESCDEVRD
jgi:hypothetical protein